MSQTARRLVDFQVYARPAGLAGDEQRQINEALFTIFEPMRLWLKEHPVKAPCRKIVIALTDTASFARWHGNVSTAIGICEVTEAVDVAALGLSAGDHRWVLKIVEHALGCVAQGAGWRSDELEHLVKRLSEATLPLVHVFDGLAQIDTESGESCVPWLSTRPGETQIGVRIGRRDVVVKSTPGPLYLEDTFPLAKSAIQGRDYVIFDKAGKRLASVAIETS